MTAPDSVTTDIAAEWLPAMLAEAVLSSGRAQILLARDAGLSEKHVSQMLTGKVAGSFDAWHALLDAAGVRVYLNTTPAERGGEVGALAEVEREAVLREVPDWGPPERVLRAVERVLAARPPAQQPPDPLAEAETKVAALVHAEWVFMSHDTSTPLDGFRAGIREATAAAVKAIHAARERQADGGEGGT